MVRQQKMHMPGVFGGIMRYDAEYQSKFIMSPIVVIVFVVLIILFVLALNFLMEAPIINTGTRSGNQGSIPPAPSQPAPTDSGGAMGGHGGVFIPLLKFIDDKV